MIKEGINNDNSKHLLYVKKEEIRLKLELNRSAFDKHLRNLQKKESNCLD
jgi:hypothetical protein